MAMGSITLAVAILSAIALVRELKRRNFLGVAVSLASILVFGFFGIMTLITGAPEA
ncbi:MULTISPECIES: DUF2759 domain-containing protein [Geomicrobium]|uniref:DUF2759 domain-containing protein n=1 Tax=Geomicrobium sediminis TaxID=1347788 RepID=A0ABS2PFC6_9BACL|nr:MULTISPECIES: DUF2759 domain-containing protein [Geomicrobium]MBM7633681.1 hypothetical protein [Geomicrobium sediminis]GAK06509.1 hypothetical protein JCM19038_208 [Geomicrobium sp. JCM 19038]